MRLMHVSLVPLILTPVNPFRVLNQNIIVSPEFSGLLIVESLDKNIISYF